MLTKLWRRLRQQDRVEELEAALKELDDELFTVAAREAKQGIRLKEIEAENDELLHYRDWECVHCSSPAPLPEDHWQTCPNHPARKRVAELERELETYKSQWKHALETYGEQEFKITNLTIANERLKQELEELEDR